MQRGWILGTGAVCLAAGYFLGQSLATPRIVFPDPDQARNAMEMETEVERLLIEPRAFVRANGLTRLFEGLTLENVEGASRAITARAGRWDPVDLQIFLTAWVQLDPENAVRSVESWPIKSRRAIGLNVGIREWAASGDGIAAANYVQSIRDPDTRGKVAGPLVRGWALSGDFQGALNLAHRLWYSENQEDVVDGFARGVLQVRGPEALLGVARQVAASGDGTFERRMVRVILNLAAREDPEAGARAFADITRDGMPEYLAGNVSLISSLWRNEDEQSALEWVMERSAAPDRERALMETIGTWAIRDFDAAWDWFMTNRGPIDRDDTAVFDATDSALMAGLVRRQARAQPTEAAVWVPRIRPGAARDQMLQRVARFYATEDAEGVEAWIDSLALPNGEDAELRKAAERGRSLAAEVRETVVQPHQAGESH